MNRRTRIAAALVAALAAAGVQAKTLRTADQGDALSMDRHSLNETTQLGFTGNVYEPLVQRDAQLELGPALATEWTQTAPATWQFKLRQGVAFHDGTPFTADDVDIAQRADDIILYRTAVIK